MNDYDGLVSEEAYFRCTGSDFVEYVADSSHGAKHHETLFETFYSVRVKQIFASA
jgi:pterin-4a-carbinolamine dehydratase